MKQLVADGCREPRTTLAMAQQFVSHPHDFGRAIQFSARDAALGHGMICVTPSARMPEAHELFPKLLSGGCIRGRTPGASCEKIGASRRAKAKLQHVQLLAVQTTACPCAFWFGFGKWHWLQFGSDLPVPCICFGGGSDLQTNECRGTLSSCGRNGRNSFQL